MIVGWAASHQMGWGGVGRLQDEFYAESLQKKMLNRKNRGEKVKLIQIKNIFVKITIKMRVELKYEAVKAM